MLDLVKLARQLQDISQHLNDEATAARLRLERAQGLLQQASDRQAELVEQQQTWRDRLGFTAAEPLEPLDTCIDLTPAPAVHTVMATDGSQIAPSHHEIAYCYLINVGRIVLHYGQNCHPLLDSVPEVFYRPEDLYISRQWGIRTEEWMGYRRTVSEAIGLAELGKAEGRRQEEANRGQKAKDRRAESGSRELEIGSQESEGLHQSKSQNLKSEIHSSTHSPLHPSTPTHPSIAMVDGSLIHWFLEPLPLEARDRLLPPMLQAWDQLRQCGIPLVGYLSAARSGEALNFLRLHSCPYLAPDCMTHCAGGTEQAPCHVFAPLRDTAMWELLLQPGQRGAIWRSSAKILECYGEHTICFCYVHVGSEIARVEFPLWVAEDPVLLETTLSLTLTQVQKGYGYPVALAEAHNQAVVRGGDRARFFAMLEQQMIRAGLKNIGTSYKEARKRGSIA